MNKSSFICFFIFMFLLLGSVSGLDSLGTFKQNTNVRVSQVCSDATYITIAVSKPDSVIAISNQNMTSNGAGEFSYNFSNTSQLGRYDVKGISDGCEKTFATYFEITPSGFVSTLGFYIVLLCIISGIVILGFSISEAWFVVLGGLGFMMLGIYSINYGVVGFRDMFMTWTIGLFEIAVGAILSIGAAWQKIGDE